MKRTAGFFLVIVLFGTACSTDKKGNLQIMLKDQPQQAERIFVNITEINVQKTGESFLTVWSGTKTYDLIALKARQEIILDTTLDTGKYTQIRMVVASGEIVINGVTYPLEVPSSEVKIPTNFEILKDGLTKIILDFDAENSIQVVSTGGGSNKYILRPVLKVESIFY